MINLYILKYFWLNKFNLSIDKIEQSWRYSTWILFLKQDIWVADVGKIYTDASCKFLMPQNYH